MIKQVLFDDKVKVGISEISDGNMRFFGDGDEADVIESQVRLGKLLDLSGDRILRCWHFVTVGWLTCDWDLNEKSPLRGGFS